jgi:hypothetical protein
LGLVGEYAGLVGEYTGLVGEYAGLRGSGPARIGAGAEPRRRFTMGWGSVYEYCCVATASAALAAPCGVPDLWVPD